MEPRKTGYIKIANQLIESNIWLRKPEWLKIWIYILIHVNYSDTTQYKRGTNYFNSKKTIPLIPGVNIDQWHKCIAFLKCESQITTQKTTRGNIITVLNYSKYQAVDTYKKLDSLPHTLPSKSDTIKEGKEGSNILPKGVDGISSLKEKRKPTFTNVQSLIDSKLKHLQIIGYYFQKTDKLFSSPDALDASVRRYLKVASEVSKFTDQEINTAFENVQVKYPSIWNLATIYKELTK